MDKSERSHWNDLSVSISSHLEVAWSLDQTKPNALFDNARSINVCFNSFCFNPSSRSTDPKSSIDSVSMRWNRRLFEWSKNVHFLHFSCFVHSISLGMCCGRASIGWRKFVSKFFCVSFSFSFRLLLLPRCFCWAIVLMTNLPFPLWLNDGASSIRAKCLFVMFPIAFLLIIDYNLIYEKENLSMNLFKKKKIKSHSIGLCFVFLRK